jgi:dCTP diphosphatase
MSDSSPNVLAELNGLVQDFVRERDWGEFHTPKNLAVSLCVEAAELLEPFQWLSTGAEGELSAEKAAQVRQEIADVFIYLIRLSDVMKIDLSEAVREKISINRKKYPADKVRGDARKYNEYD